MFIAMLKLVAEFSVGDKMASMYELDYGNVSSVSTVFSDTFELISGVALQTLIGCK